MNSGRAVRKVKCLEEACSQIPYHGSPQGFPPASAGRSGPMSRSSVISDPVVPGGEPASSLSGNAPEGFCVARGLRGKGQLCFAKYRDPSEKRRDSMRERRENEKGGLSSIGRTAGSFGKNFRKRVIWGQKASPPGKTGLSSRDFQRGKSGAKVTRPRPGTDRVSKARLGTAIASLPVIVLWSRSPSRRYFWRLSGVARPSKASVR